MRNEIGGQHALATYGTPEREIFRPEKIGSIILYLVENRANGCEQASLTNCELRVISMMR
jgi:hypothetical protein